MNYLLIVAYIVVGDPMVTTRQVFPSLEACTQAAVTIKKTPAPKGKEAWIETECVPRRPS